MADEKFKNAIAYIENRIMHYGMHEYNHILDVANIILYLETELKNSKSEAARLQKRVDALEAYIEQLKTRQRWIVDDHGEIWTFDGERIYCVAAEAEEQNGYACDTWVKAVKILIDGGYITGIETEEE